MPFSIASFTTHTGSISVAIACDAHAPTEHQRSDLASVAKKLSTMKKGGYRIAAPSQKKHQRPSYGLACSRPSHSCRKSPASRSLATALSEGALARGLLHMSRTLTIPQLNATNYPPARHRTPGDIMGIRTPLRQCQDVWPDRAVLDELPRSTNVRAATMY